MQPIAPRHLAKRESRLDLARNFGFVRESLLLVALVLVVTAVLANLPDRQGSRAAPRAQASDSTAASPRREGAFGNLVANWSFEENLDGWQVVGDADASRAPQGRTSGSCASIRPRSGRPGRVGLALPGVVRMADRGDRFVAKAWVRSAAPGLRVTLALVGSGAKPESSQATVTTPPGMAWRPVTVALAVTARADLAVQITADGAGAGDGLLVDEVTVRQG